MKNKINNKRLLMLVKANLAENSSSALMYFLISSMCAIGIVIYSVLGSLGEVNIDISSSANIDANSIFALIVIGMLVASLTIYQQILLYKTSRSCVNKLEQTHKSLLPASVEEKFIANFMVSIFIIPLLIGLVQIVIPTIILSLSNNGDFTKTFQTFDNITLMLIINGFVMVAAIATKFKKKMVVFCIIIFSIVSSIIRLNYNFSSSTQTIIACLIIIATWWLSYIGLKNKEIRN